MAEKPDRWQGVVEREWRSLLGLSELDDDKSFFDYGGTSLDAVRLLARLQKRTGRRMTIAQLFAAPTVAGIARELAATDEAIVARGAEWSGKPLPALPTHEEYLRREDWRNEHGVFDHAMNLATMLQIDGHLDLRALREAVRFIGRRHPVLRTRFRRDGDNFLIDFADEDLDLETRVRSSGPDFDEECRLDLYTPFERIDAPLVRVSLTELGGDRRVLIVKVDHLLADGWAMAVLERELLVAYDALRRGEPPELPEPALTYPEYVQQTHDWLESRAGQEDLRYWAERLKRTGPEPSVDFPLAPRPHRSPALGADAFTVDMPSGLYDVSRLSGNTPFMVFAAAVAVLLRRYTGRRDIGMLTPIVNRSAPETQGVVGWLSNTVVLAVAIDIEETLSEVLADLRRTVIEALEHGRYPRHDLIRRLQPERFGAVRIHASAYLQADTTEVQASVAEPVTVPGLRISPFGGWPTHFSRHGISFSLSGAGKHQLNVRLEDGWLDEEHRAHMAQDLAAMVHSVLYLPARTVGEVELRRGVDR
jgi:aryl carrier-like protein